MAFVRNPLVETAEAEQARLAEAPVGSLNHGLSQLPVTIPEYPEGLIIQLPNTPDAEGNLATHRIVVVPVTQRGHKWDGKGLIPRFNSTWNCIVVFSDHPSYPVGGYQICVPAAELARGRIVALEGFGA